FAVNRTFIPSQPLARNANVGLPASSSLAINGSSRSLSPLSLSPHVRRVRLAISPVSPDRRRRSGNTARSTISFISCGTPGTAYITFSAPSTTTGQINPGAVPRVCGITSAPTGTMAWRRLLAAMYRPRDSNIPAITAATSSSSTSCTPITSAMASRVRSSCVGPRPPHTITASAVANVWRSAVTTRPRLSPTFTCSRESMPFAARCSPSHALLVSTICPSSSSVPTATTSHRIGGDPRSTSTPHVLTTADERQRDGHPQQAVPQPLGVERGQRGEREAHRQLLRQGLDLGDPAGGNADTLGADERAVQADRQLAGGDDHDRHDREDAAADEEDHRSEDQHLVGQRVEKSADIRRRAMAAGEVAVDPV